MITCLIILAGDSFRDGRQYVENDEEVLDECLEVIKFLQRGELFPKF